MREYVLLLLLRCRLLSAAATAAALATSTTAADISINIADYDQSVISYGGVRLVTSTLNFASHLVKINDQLLL